MAQKGEQGSEMKDTIFNVVDKGSVSRKGNIQTKTWEERQYISKNILPVRGWCKHKFLSWELGGFLINEVANMPWMELVEK